jgi:FkbM family methyltransferase
LALSKSCLELFRKEAVPLLGQRRRALALGVPQIGPTVAELKEMFGPEIEAASYRALMGHLGFEEIMSLDVSSYEGCDIVADLNAPFEVSPGQFDLVIDNGTLEHCFNVAQAFFNAKQLCATGGVIFHNNPANWFGHGFWSFSPCVFFDFYAANGFEVQVFLRNVPAGTYEKLVYQPKVTTVLDAKRYIIHAIARKIAEVPDAIPVQQHVALLHKAAGAAAAPGPSAPQRPALERAQSVSGALREQPQPPHSSSPIRPSHSSSPIRQDRGTSTLTHQREVEPFMLIDEKNAAAMQLRETFAPLGLERFIPMTELRKVAPYFGYVEVSIIGVPGFSMLSNNDDFVAERYFWYGADAYEPTSLRVWTMLARRRAVVCDVGSYTGVFALSAAAMNPKAKVYAFEALDRVYYRLLMNKLANGFGNLQTFHRAIAEGPGECELNVYSGEGVLVTASSILEKETGRPIYEKRKVPTVSLDQLVADGVIPGVHLLKIDAERAEHLVLRGAAKLMAQHKPDVLCELLQDAEIQEVEEYFQKLGYQFYKIRESERRLELVAHLSAPDNKRDMNMLITARPKQELQALLGDLLP